MPGVTMHLLINPIGYVDASFEKHLGTFDVASPVLESIVKELQCSPLLDYPNAHRVPRVTRTKLATVLNKDRLVRFRCMIQDMAGPEFFAGVVKSQPAHKPYSSVAVRLNCSLFRDVVSCPSDHMVCDDDEVCALTCERHVFTGVAVPAISDWVYAKLEEQEQSLPSDTDVDMDHNNGAECSDGAVELPTIDEETKLSLPISVDGDNNSVVCCVKVYGSDAEELRLNDVVEFIGVLSSKSTLDDPEEAKMKCSTTPVFHALHYRKLQHQNPLMLERHLSTGHAEKLAVDFGETRRQLVERLGVLLMGDHLAAELLLCHLLSSVVHRDNVTVGKFSLNLCTFGSPPSHLDTQSLFDFVASVVTKAYYLPLTVGRLNEMTVAPRKDYGRDKLLAGVLQMSAGTLIFVDETKMEPGQLVDKGVRNVGALRRVVDNQKVRYDFRYHETEFDVNFNVLIVSEASSMLGGDCVVKLVTSSAQPVVESGKYVDVEEMLDKFRYYLSSARLLQYDIPEEVRLVVEDDFVRMRQADAAVKGDSLSRVLVLARLLTISYGEEKLNLSCWNRAKVMINLTASRT